MQQAGEWVFNKRQFHFRSTLLVGSIATVLMIIGFGAYHVEFAILWLILGLVGLVGGYLYSILMWKFFVLPQAQIRGRNVQED